MLSLIFFLPASTFAQVLQTEGFESTIFPPPGWVQYKGVTAATGAFVGQTGALTNPAATPPVGTKALIYNSASAASGDTAYLISKPYDFSLCGATNPTIDLKMYRDNGFSATLDRIVFFINDTPTYNGSATPLMHQFGTNVIHRYYNAAPAGTANAWNNYTFTLPAATYNGGPKRHYIIMIGVANAGLNMYIDDFKVNTHPSPTSYADVTMDVVQQNGNNVGIGSINQWIIGVRCIVGGNSGCGNISLNSAVQLDSLLFNTNGTTAVSDIQNARIWYTGGSQQFSTDYVSPFPAGGYPTKNYGSVIAAPSTNLDFATTIPCFHLEYDTTYFWLTYDIKPTAVGGHNVDADFREAIMTPGGGPCPIPVGTTTYSATTNIYEIGGSPQIDLAYCQTSYTVGTKWANYNSNDFINHTEFFTAVAPTQINTTKNSQYVQDPAAWCYPNCNFAGHPPDYELWANRPGQTINLTLGSSYSFRAQCGTWNSSNYIQSWIDFNHDGDFADAGEKLAPSLTNLTSLTWQNFNFTVPAAGYTGPTRMRVREVYANSNPDPCANYTYGECEDYFINILPNCPVGYNLWLGNNSNWDDPANWCGGVPKSTDDAKIDKLLIPGQAVGRSYYHPIIKTGVKANCKELYISSIDTLEINAPTPADTALRIHAGMTNNGKFIVVGSFNNSFTLSGGVLDNNINTPFRGQSPDTRAQFLYTPAELSGQGLSAGDQISQIGFNISTKASSGSYNGLTISYGLVAASNTAFLTTTPLATPFVVYGPAVYNTIAGAQTLTLSTPITWDGTSSLVLQICYDNPAGIGGNDLIKITETTGFRRFLLLTTSNGTSGCSIVPGAGVSDNFFSSIGKFRPNLTFYLNRTYKKPKVGIKGDWTNNGTWIPGESNVIFDSSAAQNIQGLNSTMFHELQIAKTAAANTVALQKQTTVDDTLWLSTGQLLLNKNTLIIDNPAGQLIASTASPVGPITRTNGHLISEDTLSKVAWLVGTYPGGGSKINHLIPFSNSALVYIPFQFDHSAGDLGTFKVATYGTPTANTPWPPTVSHVNNPLTPTNNSAAMIDRYWITEKVASGATPTIDMTFRWAATEKSSISPAFSSLSNPPKAYPWRVSPNNAGQWLRMFSSPVVAGAPVLAGPLTMTSTSPFDSLKVTAFNYPVVAANPAAPYFASGGPMPTYLPWAIAGSSSAGSLPVELLNFSGRQEGSKVKLEWNTASEINNDYFVVERSDEAQVDFDFITKVRSWFSNSSIPLYYDAYDEKPLTGLQYYRLKQVDLDGEFTYSEPVAVTFDPSRTASMPFNILSTYTDMVSSGSLNVEYSYNSEVPVDYTIVDATGRIVAEGKGIASHPGANRITLNHPLQRGMYIISLRNNEEMVSRRFVY